MLEFFTCGKFVWVSNKREEFKCVLDSISLAEGRENMGLGACKTTLVIGKSRFTDPDLYGGIGLR